MTEHVKYPFQADDGTWTVRWHIPYKVQHEGTEYSVVASIYAEPHVHGSIQVSGGAGEVVAGYDDLVPGDVVAITGDDWRIVGIEYRSRIVLAPAATEGTADV